jgi:hypothetical protein
MSDAAIPPIASPQFSSPQFAAPKPANPFARLRAAFAPLQAAFAKQARFAQVTPEILRDTGLSPQDLLGESAHDPALPFFLQSGFGQR